MSTLRAALVGWEGNQDDETILGEIRSDLSQRIPDAKELDEAAMKVFNKPKARDGDFLRNTRKFDIVVLFRIYDPEPAELSAEPTDVSPLHNPSKWREQLIESGAEYIYVWGSHQQDASICGEYLGALGGYEDIRLDTSMYELALYTRVTDESASKTQAKKPQSFCQKLCQKLIKICIKWPKF